MADKGLALGADQNKIFELACRFRVAIMECNPNSLPVTLHGFPHGSCGDASLLLAKYLEEMGQGKFAYMLGNRGDYSHAWLQRENLVVDITADQFVDQERPVIVTSDSKWHDGFVGKYQHEADFLIYDSQTVMHLCNAYRIITAIADRQTLDSALRLFQNY